ncbi:MAG: glycosyltransferase family 4 protein [Pyrobaculum sp.]
MRILVVAERYWPEGGGGELATHLIIGLLRGEAEITVVTGTPRPERVKGVNYIYEPLLRRGEKAVLWANAVRLASTKRFRELLRQHDAIYIPRYAFPVVPAAAKMGKKTVVHLHGYAPLSYTAVVLAPYERRRVALDDLRIECRKGVVHCATAAALWWLPKLARKWIRQADEVICVSKRQAQIIADAAPELREKVRVVYNPRPPEEVEKRLSEVPTFIYAGGDSRIKGLPAVIRTIALLGKRGLRTRVVLTNNYGEKTRRALEALAARYPAVEVKLTGRAGRGELARLHAEAWALLAPSIWEEPLPYAVLEAAAWATMPVASAVGGIPEITAGTPAEKYTVDLREVPQKALELAQSDPREVLKDAEKTREEVRRRFSPQEAVKRLLEAFV